MENTLLLDWETTGLGNCRGVEVGLKDGKTKPFAVRCKPAIPIELDAMVVHHITEEEVAHLPLFVDLPEYASVKKLIESRIVVAHNAPFDIDVCWREGISVEKYVDTKEIAKILWPDAPKHKLQHLRYWLKLDVSGVAHSAEGDVRVLSALWERILKEMPADELERFVRTV